MVSFTQSCSELTFLHRKTAEKRKKERKKERITKVCQEAKWPIRLKQSIHLKMFSYDLYKNASAHTRSSQIVITFLLACLHCLY